MGIVLATACFYILIFFNYPVCKTMEIQQGNHPFLCMDLSYISLLLKELGFPKNHILKVIIFNVNIWSRIIISILKVLRVEERGYPKFCFTNIYQK